MKVALNTNITKANQKAGCSVVNQNSPNFTSAKPVFIFPEEKRLMLYSTSLLDRICNAVLTVIEMERRNPLPNKHFSQTLWRNITEFVGDKQLGDVETFTVGGSPRFHQIRAYTDESEKTIAQKLTELKVKFAQVELD